MNDAAEIEPNDRGSGTRRLSRVDHQAPGLNQRLKERAEVGQQRFFISSLLGIRHIKEKLNISTLPDDAIKEISQKNQGN